LILFIITEFHPQTIKQSDVQSISIED